MPSSFFPMSQSAVFQVPPQPLYIPESMGRTGLLVMGPAGSGKTTFCASLLSHIRNSGRIAHLVNLDPAAQVFEWEPTIDIRDLISLEDVMEEMYFGPNGGLIYCFEFLLQNLDWLDEEVGEYEDDYLIFDMPGQIELYTHVPVVPSLVSHLQLNLHFRLCAAYLLESPFVIDKPKFFAGVMSAMSAMIMMEIPHINVLSKMDLVEGQIEKKELLRYMDPDPLLLADEINSETNPKYHSLNEAILRLIDDFNMVSFLPLESGDEESVAAILNYIDDATQWAEDQEPKEPKDEEFEEEEVEI